jgi:hypothetical protein
LNLSVFGVGAGKKKEQANGASSELCRALGPSFQYVQAESSPRLATLYNTNLLRHVHSHTLVLPKLKGLRWWEQLYIDGGKPELKHALISLFFLRDGHPSVDHTGKHRRSGTSKQTPSLEALLSARDTTSTHVQTSPVTRGRARRALRELRLNITRKAKGAYNRAVRSVIPVLERIANRSPTFAQWYRYFGSLYRLKRPQHMPRGLRAIASRLAHSRHVAMHSILIVVNTHLDAAGSNLFRKRQVAAIGDHLKEILHSLRPQWSAG